MQYSPRLTMIFPSIWVKNVRSTSNSWIKTHFSRPAIDKLKGVDKYFYVPMISNNKLFFVNFFVIIRTKYQKKEIYAQNAINSLLRFEIFIYRSEVSIYGYIRVSHFFFLLVNSLLPTKRLSNMDCSFREDRTSDHSTTEPPVHIAHKWFQIN